MKTMIKPFEPNVVFDDAKELPVNYVFFIPIGGDEIVLMLPILPNNINYGSNSYKNFVADFQAVYFEIEPGCEDPVGKIWIQHKKISFQCHALNPFIEAIAANKSAVIVPYNVDEGLPSQDVHGAVVPVIEKQALLAALPKITT